MLLYGFEATDAGSYIECQQSIMSRLQNILLCIRIVTTCVILSVVLSSSAQCLLKSLVHSTFVSCKKVNCKCCKTCLSSNG